MNQLMKKHRPKYTLSFNFFFCIFMLWMGIFLKLLVYPTIFFYLGMDKFTLFKKMAGEVRVGARDGNISTPTLQMQIFIHINAEIYSYY